jgi:esterase/lipase superfamily enzyme
MAKMYMVSCRREFWSATEFSTADEIRELDLTGDGQGAKVQPATLLAALANKRVTVLVHGYNNEQRDVLDSYKTIDDQMRLLGFLGRPGAAYDALIGFAWPGGGSGVSFPFARGRAGEAAPRLQRLLSDLRGSGATVDVNSHSLGAHVTFEALKDAPTTMVRNAWNFASAVDNESIEKGERYFTATQRCQRFYVFHSKNDPVLRVWYRIGDFFDFDTALGYSGPEDPRAIMDYSGNLTVINCKDVVASHGGYRSAGQVWSFMQQELSAPGSAQFVTLEKSPATLRAVFRASGGAVRIARQSTRPSARHAARKGTRGKGKGKGR